MATTRYSRQRELIYQTLMATDQHPTAEMIYQMLKPSNPSLSLGTVYRNLNLMVDEGRVTRMPFAVDRYDGRTEEHAHFLCVECGNLYDLSFISGDELEEEMRRHGYQVEHFDLIFRGVCGSCQRTSKKAT